MLFRSVVDSGPSGENIQALMRDMEVAADRARSVREAMELVRSGAEGQRYQLVLLDWEIPDLDADRAAEGIRTLLPQALIVFLTESEEEDIQIPRTEKTGMIPKPFFVSALKEKVAQMQGGGKAQGSAEEEESGLEGLNFLAVEDNEINAEILREILAMEGASYELVENGQQAVERFLASAEGEFDAILMDVQMPVMNGYDATRAIRALERGDAGQILIIAMTANAFVEDEKEALNAGMNVHLAKPVDVELLRQILKEYVKKESRTGK